MLKYICIIYVITHKKEKKTVPLLRSFNNVLSSLSNISSGILILFYLFIYLCVTAKQSLSVL